MADPDIQYAPASSKWLPLSVCLNVMDEKPIDVDDFFDKAELIQERVTDSLVNSGSEFVLNMWGRQSPLIHDPGCRVNMGRKVSLEDRMNGATSYTRELYKECQGCNLMKLLVNIDSLHPISKHAGDVEVWNVFSPEYGSRQKQQYQIVKYCDVKLSAKVSDLPNIIIGKIIQQNNKSVSCQPALPLLKDTEYHSLDRFSSAILINWYIECVSDDMPFVRHLVYPFICGSDGYMLMSHNDSMKIDKYDINDASQALNLMLQMFSMLHKLKDHEFSFQSITMDTLLIEKARCEYKYDGMPICENFTLKLNRLDDAGINVYLREMSCDCEDEPPPIRIYRNRGMLDEFYSQIIRNVISWDRHYGLASKPGEEPPSWVTYQIAPPERRLHDFGLYGYGDRSVDRRSHTEDNKNAFLHTNRLGIPLYQGSFDAYRLMLLLCENKGFYRLLMEDEKLNILWRSFWTPGNYDAINHRVRQHHASSSSNNYPYTEMLMGLDLRCNLISHVWGQLRVSYVE